MKDNAKVVNGSDVSSNQGGSKKDEGEGRPAEGGSKKQEMEEICEQLK